MSTRRINTKRPNEDNLNEALPLQAHQNPQVTIEEEAMSIFKIRVAIHSLTQMLELQVDRDTRVHVNPNARTTASRIRNLTRMNPLTFFCSKV